MTVQSKAKAVLTIVGLSVILFLCTCWFLNLSIYAASCIEGVCFFLFSWLCADKLKTSGMSLITLALWIILGRILVEIPIRISDFAGSFASLIVTIISVASILLAILCYHERRTSVYVLSTIIFVLFNTVVLQSWLSACERNFAPC